LNVTSGSFHGEVCGRFGPGRYSRSMVVIGRQFWLVAVLVVLAQGDIGTDCPTER
jgi:hypothetical protein